LWKKSINHPETCRFFHETRQLARGLKQKEPEVLWFHFNWTEPEVLYYDFDQIVATNCSLMDFFFLQISGNQQFFAVIFLLQNFASLQKVFWKKEYSIKIPCSFESNLPKYQKSSKNLPKITTIANDLKQLHPIFFTFIFLISPNLAKYTYERLPPERHHKIEKKSTGSFILNCFPNRYLEPAGWILIWSNKRNRRLFKLKNRLNTQNFK